MHNITAALPLKASIHVLYSTILSFMYPSFHRFRSSIPSIYPLLTFTHHSDCESAHDNLVCLICGTPLLLLPSFHSFRSFRFRFPSLFPLALLPAPPSHTFARHLPLFCTLLLFSPFLPRFLLIRFLFFSPGHVGCGRDEQNVGHAHKHMMET